MQDNTNPQLFAYGILNHIHTILLKKIHGS